MQGINIIDAANKQKRWNIDFKEVLQIWRAGCIIQADQISEMLQPIFDDFKHHETMNLLFEKSVAQDLKKSFPSLKRIVAAAVDKDHVTPALSATLEYLKYETSTGES